MAEHTPENLFRIEYGTPAVDGSAYIAPTAVVIGAVTMGPRSSLWPGTIARADHSPISIGEDTNIQDCSSMHADPGFPLTIGARVSAGHKVILHGCTIHDDVLIGMGSIVMNGAEIGSGSIVGAGALVTQGMKIPPNSMVLGAPAKVVRETTDAEREQIDRNWRGYVDRIDLHTAAVRVDRAGQPVD